MLGLYQMLEPKPRCARCRQKKTCVCGRALPMDVAKIWPDGEMRFWCRCGQRYLVADECFIAVQS